MNIKRMSSKVIALALSALMIFSAAYVGIESLISAGASGVSDILTQLGLQTEYIVASESYYTDKSNKDVPTLDKSMWEFKALQYSNISNAMSPVVSNTYDMYHYAKNVGIGGFTNQQIRADHWGDNENFIPYYNFDISGTSNPTIRFCLVDGYHDTDLKTYTYGSQISLKADSNIGGKVYDFQGNLKVSANRNSTGYIYVRAVTKKGSTVTTVWPKDTAWEKYEVTSANYNPDFELTPFEVELKVGETFMLEAYADLTNGDNILVDFGNIALNTVYDREMTEVETSTTYHIVDYDLQIANGRYTGSVNPNDSRIRFGVFTSCTCPKCTEIFYPINHNRTEWGGYLSREIHKADGTLPGTPPGFHYGTADHYNDKLYAETREGAGVAYQFIVPYSGTVYMAINAKNSAGTAEYRVLLNGNKIHPIDKDWAACPTTDTLVDVATHASAEDVITVQYRTEGEKTTLGINQTTFTVVSNKYKNLSTGSSYGAAFDVPYAGSTFKGEYTVPERNMFNFGIADISAGEITYADYYDSSKGNYLYVNSEDYSGLGFKFNNNNLLTTVRPTTSSEPDGDSLAAQVEFKMPSDGRYDIALGGKLSSGSGKINYRVIMDGAQVYPEGDGWCTVTGDASYVPVEVTGTAGSVVVIQYAVTESRDSAATINLGTLSVYKAASDIPKAKGFYRYYPSNIYEPLSYSNYNGDIVPQATRFSFSVGGAAFTKFNSNAKLFSTANGKSIIDFTNANLSATIESGKTLRVNAVVPETSEAMVTLSPSGNGQFRILYDGVEKLGWKNTDGAYTEVLFEAEAGKVITFEYKATSGNIILGLPAIQFEGMHTDNNDASADIFYALNSHPYYKSDYVGPYVQKQGIWNYDALKVDKVTNAVSTVATDYYDAATGYLTHTASGAGYVLGTKDLSYMFKTDADNYYGMSLKFIAPKEDSAQEYDMGVVAPISGNTGKAYFRVTHNGKTIWPTDKQWAEQDLSLGGTLNFPLLEFKAAQGDEIRFEMYVDSETTVNLGSPYIKVTSKTPYLTTDVEAEVYALKNYNIFQKASYNGKISLPESRWNVGLFNVTIGKDGAADEISEKLEVDTYSSANNLFYNNGSDAYSGVRIVPSSATYGMMRANTNTAHGISYSFTSPVEKQVFLVGTPALNANNLALGAELYMRVVVSTLKEDGTYTDKVVWPADQSWGVANADTNGYTGFTGMYIDLKVGDKVEYQMYCKSATITEKTTLFSGDLGDPSVFVISRIADGDSKTKFNINTDWTPFYQVSPFWRYLAAPDSSNPEWSQISVYNESWGNMYLISNGTACGIMRTGTRSHKDIDHWKINGTHHALATQLTVPKTGYLTIKSSTVTSSTIVGYARITLTRDGVTTNLWPEEDGDWVVVNLTKVAQPELMFSCQAGDIIRFETSVANTLDYEKEDLAGKSVYISWANAAEWTKVNPETLGDKNIYGTLDEFMLAHFKELAEKMGSTQFDEDYEAHKYLAENPPEEEEEIVEDTSSEEDYEDYEEPESEPEADDEEEDEEDDTSSKKKRRKKVIKYIVVSGGLPLWAIILICVGAAVLLAGIIVLIIVLVKRKKKGEEVAEGAVAEGESASPDNPESSDEKEE